MEKGDASCLPVTKGCARVSDPKLLIGSLLLLFRRSGDLQVCGGFAGGIAGMKLHLGATAGRGQEVRGPLSLITVVQWYTSLMSSTTNQHFAHEYTVVLEAASCTLNIHSTVS